jgi:hypothetical protein
MHPSIRKFALLGSSVLVVCGAAFRALSPTDAWTYSLGVWLLLAGGVALASCIGVSSQAQGQQTLVEAVWRHHWLNMKQTWKLGAAVAVALVVSFYALHIDAVNGAEQVWPVYFFAGSGFSALIYYMYIAGRQPR